MRIVNETPKYAKTTTTVKIYDTGLMTWDNIDNFYNVKIRDKIICRFDAMYYLNKFFKPETIKKYRQALWVIMTAQCTDPKIYSSAINKLIEEDEVFASQIYNIFTSCPEDKIFGYYLMEVFARTILEVENTYRSFFRHKSEVVICLSNGYLYFSISDKDTVIKMPDEVECEVLYVKDWKGKFIV